MSSVTREGGRKTGEETKRGESWRRGNVLRSEQRIVGERIALPFQQSLCHTIPYKNSVCFIKAKHKKITAYLHGYLKLTEEYRAL